MQIALQTIQSAHTGASPSGSLNALPAEDGEGFQVFVSMTSEVGGLEGAVTVLTQPNVRNLPINRNRHDAVVSLTDHPDIKASLFQLQQHEELIFNVGTEPVTLQGTGLVEDTLGQVFDPAIESNSVDSSSAHTETETHQTADTAPAFANSSIVDVLLPLVLVLPRGPVVLASRVPDPPPSDGDGKNSILYEAEAAHSVAPPDPIAAEKAGFARPTSASGGAALFETIAKAAPKEAAGTVPRIESLNADFPQLTQPRAEKGRQSTLSSFPFSGPVTDSELMNASDAVVQSIPMTKGAAEASSTLTGYVQPPQQRPTLATAGHSPEPQTRLFQPVRAQAQSQDADPPRRLDASKTQPSHDAVTLGADRNVAVALQPTAVSKMEVSPVSSRGDEASASASIHGSAFVLAAAPVVADTSVRVRQSIGDLNSTTAKVLPRPRVSEATRVDFVENGSTSIEGQSPTAQIGIPIESSPASVFVPKPVANDTETVVVANGRSEERQARFPRRLHPEYVDQSTMSPSGSRPELRVYPLHLSDLGQALPFVEVKLTNLETAPGPVNTNRPVKAPPPISTAARQHVAQLSILSPDLAMSRFRQMLDQTAMQLDPKPSLLAEQSARGDVPPNPGVSTTAPVSATVAPPDASLSTHLSEPARKELALVTNAARKAADKSLFATFVPAETHQSRRSPDTPMTKNGPVPSAFVPAVILQGVSQPSASVTLHTPLLAVAVPAATPQGLSLPAAAVAQHIPLPAEVLSAATPQISSWREAAATQERPLRAVFVPADAKQKNNRQYASNSDATGAVSDQPKPVLNFREPEPVKLDRRPSIAPGPILFAPDPQPLPAPALSPHATHSRLLVPSELSLRPLPKGTATNLAHSITQGGHARAELVLEPSELGRIRFDLITQGDQVQVNLVIERPETLDLLRANAETLRQEFRAAGLETSTLSFSQWGQRGQEHGQPDRRGDDALPAAPTPIAIPVQVTKNTSGTGLDIRL